MKRIITLALFAFISLSALAQQEGISYQAVIIGPDDLELPGVDSEGNYLPSTDIIVKFSIIKPGTGIVEFTEEQETTTDEFGRINLIIGQGNYDDFEKIYWDGNEKSLKVEIDFRNGDGFVDLSIEKLTYVPYIQHRTIKASDSLIVDGNTELKGDLTVVNQPTNLGGIFNVNGGNRSNLSGDLTVEGETNLARSLTVGDGSSGIDNDAPTLLNGTLDVIGKTTVGDFEATGQATFDALEANTLQVNNSTTLLGQLNVDSNQQIVLKSNVHTDAITYANNADGVPQAQNDPGRILGNYPVLVEGSTQGIAVRVIGNRRNGNNFVSFWDDAGQWGRIEGEIPSEYANNADWLFDQSSLDYDIYDAWVDYGFALANEIIAGAQMVKAASDYRPCTGFGACVVTPGVADIIFSGLEMVSATAQAIAAAFAIGRAEDNKDEYDRIKNNFVGVTYASGAGDYAEYLLRENINEKITYGDIVGVKGGKISKNTQGAERMLVVSFQPIVLGNAPKPNEEQNYEKVAFMGQIPVKVFGKVNIGDYILPSGKNDGVGKAIAPSELTTKHISQIVGIAWSTSQNIGGFNMVNVAVGLNKNDNNPIVERLEEKIEAQAQEINALKNEIAKIHEILSGNGQTSVVANTDHDSKKKKKEKAYDDRKHEFLDTPKGEIVYFEISRSDFEKGLVMAQEQMLTNGIDVENHPFWKKMKEDPAFKEEILQRMEAKFEQQLHYHKDVSLKSGN